MNQNKRRVSAVDDGFEFGLYVWKFPDGTYLSDGDGNFLNVAGVRHDIAKMALLQDAVRHYGIEEGSVVFLPGHSRATEEEYEDDKSRFLDGMTPYGDFGAYKDGLKTRR